MNLQIHCMLLVGIAQCSYSAGTGCRYYVENFTVMCTDLRLTYMPQLDPAWVPNITRLNFVGNNIVYVDPHYIAKFSNLKLLDLRGQRVAINCTTVNSLPTSLIVLSDCPQNETRSRNNTHATAASPDFTKKRVTVRNVTVTPIVNGTRRPIEPITGLSALQVLGIITILLSAITFYTFIIIAILCNCTSAEDSYHPARVERHYKRADSYQLAVANGSGEIAL